MTDPQVRKLEGEAVIEWLRRAAVLSFRYEPNVAGMWMLILGGFFSFIVAGAVAWFADVQALLTKSVILVFAFTGAWLWYRQVWWFRFLVKTYVAVTDEEVLVGTGEEAYALAREALTRDAVKVEEMQRGRLTMVLPLRLQGFAYDVYLFGPFVKLKNLQAFTGLLIQHFYDPEELEAAAEEAEAAEQAVAAEPDRASDDAHDADPTQEEPTQQEPPAPIVEAAKVTAHGPETRELFGVALDPATEVRGRGQDT